MNDSGSYWRKCDMCGALAVCTIDNGAYICEVCGTQLHTIEPPKPDCVFCQIVRKEAPAQITVENEEVIAIIPLNPVVPGHRLVIPKQHVKSAVSNPVLTGKVMMYAAGLAFGADQPCNIITSVGAEATQTIFHLHIHIVPRRAGDGLLLPWSEIPKMDGG